MFFGGKNTIQLDGINIVGKKIHCDVLFVFLYIVNVFLIAVFFYALLVEILFTRLTQLHFSITGHTHWNENISVFENGNCKRLNGINN